MTLRTYKRGFTIVELLIVVVVIAILAAIIMVAYNGISGRAQDASLASQASQLEKRVRTNQALWGSEAVIFRLNGEEYGSLYLNRDMFLEYNNLTAAADDACVEIYLSDGNDAFSESDAGCFPTFTVNQVPQYNKKKLYISGFHDTYGGFGTTTLAFSYWNSESKKWINETLHKPLGANEVITSERDDCKPVTVIGGTFDAQCRYVGP